MAYVYDTIRQSLELVGATPADIVRQRVFIVGLTPAQRPIIMKAMMDFYGDNLSATSTCVGVDALLLEGALVEIDVTAVIGAWLFSTGSRMLLLNVMVILS